MRSLEEMNAALGLLVSITRLCEQGKSPTEIKGMFRELQSPQLGWVNAWIALAEYANKQTGLRASVLGIVLELSLGVSDEALAKKYGMLPGDAAKVRELILETPAGRAPKISMPVRPPKGQ